MRDKRLWCLRSCFVWRGVDSFIGPGLGSTPGALETPRRNYKMCVSKCQEEFRVDKDSCHKIDHECAEDCRVEFEDCVDKPLDSAD